MFPPYRIKINWSHARSRNVMWAQFKFNVSVWVEGAAKPVTVLAALDTFAETSILPTRTFVALGGFLPPTVTPPPGRQVIDNDTVEFAFPDAPAPMNQFRFASQPCRLHAGLKEMERFHLSLRDLLNNFALRFEYDSTNQLHLVLELNPKHRGRPIDG